MAWNLIVDKKANQWFTGHAEECEYSFSLGPEQIPGMGWAASVIIDAHNNALADQGSLLLELQVWEDKSPTWTTEYYVRIVATASPLFWNIIIGAALLLLIGVTIAFTINQVSDVIYYVGEKAPGTIQLWSLSAFGLVLIGGMYMFGKLRGKSA